MQLVGVIRWPYTRRVAIVLELYGIPYRLRALAVRLADQPAFRATEPQ